MKQRLGGGQHDNRGARAAAAIAITKDVHLFKLCEGCGSIVSMTVSVCPHCHAYRYNTNPEQVRRAALALGRKRPDKLTNG